MNPTVAEILTGATVAIANPLPPEAGPEFAASRTGMLATLNMLAGREADRGVAVRVWENAAIRAVLGEAGPHDDGRFAAAAAETDELSLTALDAANADLRRLLIALHQAVEAARDAVFDRRILELYREMAHARRLELPGA